MPPGPDIRELLQALFARPDTALWTDTTELFMRSGRRIERDGVHHFSAPYPVMVVRDGAARSWHVQLLRQLLRDRPQGRAGLAFRGELTPEARVSLNQLRMAGHPVMPLPASWIEAALADGNPASALRDHERRYFDGQNLFAQSNSITDQGLFFGRTRLLNALGGALSSQNSVLLTGQRKVGKTSALHMLRQNLTGAPWAWVDLQQLAPDEDWRSVVFEEIVHATDRWGQSRHPGQWPWVPGEHSGVGIAAAMAKRLSWMTARGADRQVFLVLDEVERIMPTEKRPGRAQRFVDLTGPLRAFAQGPDRWLTLIAADLRPTVNRINQLPGGETNPLYLFFQEQPLPLFSLDETEHMIRTIAELMGTTVEEGIAAKIHQLTGGHPYLSRLIAGYAYEAREDGVMDTAALAAALDIIDQRWELGDFFEQNIWRMLTTEERAVLVHLAQSEEAAGARPPAELGLTTSQWRRALRDLRDQGLLDGSDALAMPGLVEWLRDEGLLQRIASK